MSEDLTIAEFVARARARKFPDDGRLPYARVPWAPDSKVIWAGWEGSTSIVRDGEPYEFFVEPFIIVEALEDLFDNSDQDLFVKQVIRFALDEVEG